MNMNLFLTLPAKPELNCLKATAKLCTLWSYSQRKHATHLLSKISIKHVYIFNSVRAASNNLQRKKKTEQQLVVFIDEKLSRTMDRKIVSTVPRQHNNFLVAEAKNAKSHISRCLVTLLLGVVFLLYIWHEFPEHTFWNGSFQHVEIH